MVSLYYFLGAPPPILLKSYTSATMKYLLIVEKLFWVMKLLLALLLKPMFWFKRSLPDKETIRLSHFINFLLTFEFQMRRAKSSLKDCVFPLNS